MAILAQSIVNDARVILNDPVGGVRWLDAEMLAWINAGRRDMAVIKPSWWGITAKRRVTLIAGAYQTLPDLGVTDAHSLVSVLNNVTATNTPGSTVSLVDRGVLDAFRPGWIAETGKEVQNWIPDPANRLAFWVNPAVAGGKLDLNVGVTPADLATLNEVAVPLDVMATTLMHYVLYRAYAKDAEVAANKVLSDSYFALFTAAMSGN